MQVVEDTFRTLHTALIEAVNFFSKGISLNGVPLTQQQAVDVLEVYDTLLNEEETEIKNCAHIVQCSLESRFISFLANILTQPLQHVHEFDAQLPQPFLALRMKSIKSLQKLLTTCSNLGDSFSSYCFKISMSEDLLTQLLRTLSESPYEFLRLSVAETLFIFILRIQDGSSGFVIKNGINTICRSLLGDTSYTVRSVCASILREIVQTHPIEFTSPGTLTVLVKELEDNSDDVRAIVAEIIDQTLRYCSTKMIYILQDPSSLIIPMQKIFEKDPSVEVVESIARLFETCCGVAASMNLYSFFASMIPINFVKTLLQRISEAGNSGAARARSLRLLILYTPATFEISRYILEDNELLAILLKGIVDAGRGRTINGEDYAAFQIKNVELALCLSIILCQSSNYREFLGKELQNYPQWAAAIKNAVVSLLNAASLDYFTNIELQDITGYHLNSLQGVNWDIDNTPQRIYVHKLFQEQTQRINEMSKNISINHNISILPKMNSNNHNNNNNNNYNLQEQQEQEQEEVKKVRLTFIILIFATHITFPVDSLAAVEGNTGIGVQSHVENRTLSQFPQHLLKSPSYSRQREYVMNPDGLMSVYNNNNNNNNIKSSKDRSTMSNEEKEAMAIAYDKFNSSMTFVLKYAQHYSSKKLKDEDFLETQDGYLIRTSRLKNPWHAIVENQRLKTWQVNDLKVGDLFYFSLPFDEIDLKSMEVVLHKARKHMIYLKKELITTPQNSKGRRWFIHDMFKNVMPNAILNLDKLKQFVQSRGGEGVRFPIFLFREKELHFGERALHPGNLEEVVNQIEFYFSQSVEKTVGVDNERLLQLAKKLDNIEKNASMNNNFECSSQGIHVSVENKKENQFQEEIENYSNNYGHGTISSDSESDV